MLTTSAAGGRARRLHVFNASLAMNTACEPRQLEKVLLSAPSDSHTPRLAAAVLVSLKQCTHSLGLNPKVDRGPSHRHNISQYDRSLLCSGDPGRHTSHLSQSEPCSGPPACILIEVVFLVIDMAVAVAKPLPIEIRDSKSFGEAYHKT